MNHTNVFTVFLSKAGTVHVGGSRTMVVFGWLAQTNFTTLAGGPLFPANARCLVTSLDKLKRSSSDGKIVASTETNHGKPKDMEVVHTNWHVTSNHASAAMIRYTCFIYHPTRNHYLLHLKNGKPCNAIGCYFPEQNNTQ
eukprot:1415622-Amphidinium_carterae.1